MAIGAAPIGSRRVGMASDITPTVIRVPVSTVAGEVIYREIDLRANGDDPLMRWMRGSFDWDVTNLKWDEKFQQPREVTWRGGTLWDPELALDGDPVATDGEVEVIANDHSPLPAHAAIRVPVRGNLRGTMKIHGFTWVASAPSSKQPANALWCETCQKLVRPEDTAAAPNGPYRSAGGVYPNCTRCGVKPLTARTTEDAGATRIRVIPPTLLWTSTGGPALIDDAFKVGIDSSIRQALNVFMRHRKM